MPSPDSDLLRSELPFVNRVVSLSPSTSLPGDSVPTTPQMAPPKENHSQMPLISAVVDPSLQTHYSPSPHTHIITTNTGKF